jgi:hypothetical protein
MWYYSCLMNRIGRFIIPVLLAVFIPGCQDHRAETASLPSPELEQEEYDVYSFLVNDRSDSENDPITIISDSTVPVHFIDMPLGYSHSNIFRTRYYIPGFDGKIYIAEIGEDTLADFEQKNQHPSLLDYKFNIKEKYLLFSHEEYMDMDPLGPFWYKFDSRYPNSSGILSYSRVGFNCTRDKAIVYESWWAGSTAGSGRIILLIKVNGVWTLKNGVLLWVS